MLLTVTYVSISIVDFRDVAYLGTCDEGCFQLAEMLGWKVRLRDDDYKTKQTLAGSQGCQTNIPLQFLLRFVLIYLLFD